ncbi:MAG: sensor histidine kinase, partial [Asticcacaulis sp.]
MSTGGPVSDTAESRLRAREDFLKLMSHEIRTPLNGVMGMLGLLSRTALDSEQQAYVRNARDCGDHLLTLVNALLDYAKIEAGKLELEDGPVDLEALLQGVCELLSPRAHEKNIELIQALGPGPARILGDEGRLRQILFNLAGNAVKFTQTGGVAILAETDGARVHFSVRDTGPGIPEEARERIFEEFGHADAADASRHGGAGLGLAVVRRLVEAMDGELGLDSTPGAGSTFWFSLPLRPIETENAKAPGLLATPVRIHSPNPVLRDGAARQIQTSGGLVRGEQDPAHPEAVLLADRSAFEGPTPRPEGYGGALILLRPEDRDEIPGWRAAGWDGYLIKPLRRSSLVARIRACLAPV